MARAAVEEKTQHCTGRTRQAHLLRRGDGPGAPAEPRASIVGFRSAAAVTVSVPVKTNKSTGKTRKKSRPGREAERPAAGLSTCTPRSSRRSEGPGQRPATRRRAAKGAAPAAAERVPRVDRWRHTQSAALLLLPPIIHRSLTRRSHVLWPLRPPRRQRTRAEPVGSPLPSRPARTLAHGPRTDGPEGFCSRATR